VYGEPVVSENTWSTTACESTGFVNTEGSYVGEEPRPRISPSFTFIATKAPG
jgi:hypothetical protein